MMKKFLNALTIASLFVAGTYAKCSNEVYGCCKDSNAEVYYVDEEGNWSVENDKWCLIEPEEPEVTTSIKIPEVTSTEVVEPTEAPSTEVIKGDTFDSMFIGAWVGGPEKLPEYPQPNAKNVASFEKLQDRHLDVINLFVIWQYHEWSWTKEYLDVAKANGSILMMTWMPTPYTAQDILDGKGDAYIDSYIKGIKEFGEEVWLRPLHEANGDWYTWGAAADSVNNSEDKLAEAYRYLVDKFREAKVSNVKWIWTTNCNSSGSATLTGSYPGDDYVDYTSIDGYNWGTAQSWSKWNTFEEVFTDAYNALSKFNKPMILAEFSSSETGGDKAAWFEHMFEVLPTKFPRIVGLIVFSESKPDNEGDWGIDSSEAAAEAWKKGISAYPPAKRINSGETPSETIPVETPTETTTVETTPVTPTECWSEKFGYKCCSAGNTRVVEVDESGKWGAENGEWCGISETDDTCWSVSLGYKCCTDCEVITTDESGKWGANNGEWCGIVEETCKN